MQLIRSRRVQGWFLFSFAALVLAGCAARQSMDDKKKEMIENYRGVRSGLIMQAAQQYFDTGDLEQAKAQCVDALGQDPENAEAILLLGRIELENGRLERAFNRFEQALSINDQLQTAYYFKGIVLQRWTRYDRALEAFEKAYELEADNVFYLLAVSETLVALDRLDDAISRVEQKVTYFGQNADIRLALGHLYSLKKDFPKAVHYLTEASLLEPDELQIVEDLAMVQMAAGDKADAIANLERLASEKSYADRLDIRNALAKCYFDEGRRADAKALYLEQMRINPRDPEVWIRLGEIAWAEGDLSGALKAADQVMALAPNRHEGYLLSGLVWKKRDRLVQAVKYFDKAAEVAPTRSMPLILRGMSLEQAGRKDLAIKSYEEALRRQPDDVRAQRLLAAVQQTD